MGLFSKKHNNDYKNGQLPDEEEQDSFWNFSPIKADRAYDTHSLTAEEILGEPAKHEKAEKHAVSPAERLMHRMAASKEPPENENENKKKKGDTLTTLSAKEILASITAKFDSKTQTPGPEKTDGVSKNADEKQEPPQGPAPFSPISFEDEKNPLSLTAEFDSIISNLSANIKSAMDAETQAVAPETHGNSEAAPAPQENSESIPPGVEKTGDIQPVSDVKTEEIKEEVSPDEPTGAKNEETEAPENEDKDEKTAPAFDGSAFGRFFINENGTSAVNNKPLYSLDSVETILAEAEKKAAINAGIRVTTPKTSSPEKDDGTVIDMAPAPENEYHYYADEHIPDLEADTTQAGDTVYSPGDIDITSETAAEVELPKPKPKKSKFKVEVEYPVQTDVSPAFEYNCPEDAPRIRAHLKKINRVNELKLWLTVLAEAAAVLFMYVLPLKLASLPVTNVIAAFVISLINIDLLAGITGAFDTKKSLKTPLAFSMIATILHSVYCVIVQNTLPSAVPHLSVIFGMIVIFYLIGIRIQNKRLFRNFRIVANNDPKNAIDLISDPVTARTIASDAIEGDVLIAAGRKTANIVGFMKHSFSDYPYAKTSAVCALLSLVVGLAAFLATMFTTKNTSDAVTAFSCAILLACPLTVTLNATLPLWLAAKRLSLYRAFLPGHSSAEQLSQVNAVAVNAYDLFPKGSVKLCGMKALSPNELDETILYSAVLCEAAQNPLAPLFRKIANTNESPKAPLSDSIKYEYKMGLSGWVNDSQLLIGNRTLMEAHSVRVPSLETDRMILEKGYFPVYVARDGSACALLAVSYTPNKEVMYELRRLCNSGVTLLVNTNDPNITDNMLCDYFGLYEECVRVMRDSASTAYKESTNYQESTIACGAFSKSVCGLLGAVTAANKIKSLSVIQTVIYVLFSVIGAVGIVLLAISGRIGTVSTLYLALFQALALLVGILPPYLSRP